MIHFMSEWEKKFTHKKNVYKIGKKERFDNGGKIYIYSVKL